MNEVYKIKYNRGLLLKPIETNEELYHRIFSEINGNMSEIVVISFNCDRKFKYENDMINKISFIDKIIENYDSRFELPYYEEEIKAINHILIEFNKDVCTLYKQIPPLANFLASLIGTNNCKVFNIDFNIKYPSISHLIKKYKDFPKKIELINNGSSKNDIEEINKNIRNYYKYQRDEIDNVKIESSLYKFDKFSSDMNYSFININYLLDPSLNNGNLMPVNEASDFLTSVQKLATIKNKIILINDGLEIISLILPKMDMIKLKGKGDKEKIKIIKDINFKFKMLPILKSDDSIKEMFKCEFGDYSFLL
jgi:hypothetical protein